MSRARTMVLNLTLLVSALVISMGVAEFALRAFAPNSDRHFVLPPGEVSIMVPDGRYIAGITGASRYETSSLGIRGAEFGPTGQEYRILAIGGSTTQNLYQDQEETWTLLLGKLLGPTADGRATWTGDVGRPGHTARHHVLQFEYLLSELPPIDAVIVLVGVNDLTYALSPGADYQRPAPLTDPKARAVDMLEAFVQLPGRFHERRTDFLTAETNPIKRLALYQLAAGVKSAWNLRQQNRVQDPGGEIYGVWRSHRANASVILDTPPDLHDRVGVYREYLEMLADMAEARGVRLVLATQPALWRADLTAEENAVLWLGGLGDFQSEPGHAYYSARVLEQAMTTYNNALLAVCAERQLDCVDLAAKVPKTLDSFYDDVHFTEAGGRRVAEALAQHFSELPPYSRSN